MFWTEYEVEKNRPNQEHEDIMSECENGGTA